MSIEISIVKSPDSNQSNSVCQIFTERGGSIGRSEDNTWAIEDPERFISSRHTQIVFLNGQYYLSDLSTNGTFLNDSVEPIGNGNRVILKDGDRFSLGEYEFLVSMQADNSDVFEQNLDPFSSGILSGSVPLAEDGIDQFDNAFAGYDDPFAAQSVVSPIIPDPSISSDHEADPLAALDKINRSNQDNPFQNTNTAGNQADNVDPMQHAAAWPNAIPDDWELDEIVSDSSSPASKTYPEVLPENDINEKLIQTETQRESLARENEQLLSDIMQLKQKIKNLQSTSDNQGIESHRTPADKTLVDAMGLGHRGLSEQKKSEISATVGLLIRESIAGLMQTLSFRKKIKEEFRINVTTIQPIENNPLKFSANIEDALENMFVKDNKAYMKPLDAVKESFQGISEHQIAVLAGIQAAFRGMIERLDPEALEKRFEKYRKTGVIKVGQKGKNWESYKEFHQDLVDNIDNSFQYLFGYDFVQAYEEQLQKLLFMRKSKTKANS